MNYEELFYVHLEDYDRLLNSENAFARAIKAYKEQDYIRAHFEIESIENPDNFVLLLKIKIYHHFFRMEQEAIDKSVEIVNRLKNEEHDYDFKVDFAYVLKECGFYSQADEIFTELLNLTPYEPKLWFDYGMMFDFIDDEKAIDILHRAYYHFLDYKESLLGLKRRYAFDMNATNLQNRLDRSNSLKDIDELDAFIYEKLILNIAFLYFRTFRYRDALNLFKEAEFYNVNNVRYFSMYAEVLEYVGDYKNALKAYEKALFLKADKGDYFSFSKFLLRIQATERGFALYEYRLNWAFDISFSEKYYRFAYREFCKNKSFLKDKRVLVYCEQGYGDTIMFGRILTRLCTIAREVIFAPQSRLYSLFEFHIKKLKTQNKLYANLKVVESLNRDFDYAVPICSLFYFLGITDVKSIAKMPTPIVSIKNKICNSRKKIGFFFQTPNATSHKSLFWRNMDLQWLLDALESLDVELINFTYEHEEKLPNHIKDLSKELVDWLDTSIALEEIDLLISIDSAIAHLGLALGVPTLVVLGQRFEWRWGKLGSPSSFFWPKAHILVINDPNEDKETMRKLVVKILGL